MNDEHMVLGIAYYTNGSNEKRYILPLKKSIIPFVLRRRMFEEDKKPGDISTKLMKEVVESATGLEFFTSPLGHAVAKKKKIILYACRTMSLDGRMRKDNTYELVDAVDMYSILDKRLKGSVPSIVKMFFEEY